MVLIVLLVLALIFFGAGFLLSPLLWILVLVVLAAAIFSHGRY